MIGTITAAPMTENTVQEVGGFRVLRGPSGISLEYSGKIVGPDGVEREIPYRMAVRDRSGGVLNQFGQRCLELIERHVEVVEENKKIKRKKD